MKRILVLSFLFMVYVFFASQLSQAQLTQVQQSYNSAVTFYVCPSGQTTCSYDGDAGTSATPSDSNNCLTKATPCATIAGVRTLIANKSINAVITIQLADQSGGRCYQPDSVMFDQSTRGGSTGIFDTAFGGETDSYPSSYIYIRGNLTTPNNVPIVGATTCAGTTATTLHAFQVNKSTMRVAGVQFRYYKSGQINGNNGALIYAETLNAVGQPDMALNPDENGVISLHEQSHGRLGGAMTITDQPVAHATGTSTYTVKTPAGYLNLTYSASGSSYPQFAFLVNEKSHFYLEGLTATFSGSGTYNAIGALVGSTVNFNSDANISITVNGANITWLKARQSAYIGESCGGSGQTCTFTSMSRRAWADDNAIITLGVTSGFGTNGNMQQAGGRIQQYTSFPNTNMYMPNFTSEERQLVVTYLTAGSQLYHAPNFSFTAQEGTLASPTALTSGHVLGYVNFVGYDGSTNRGAAMMRGEATGNYSGSNFEGKLVFATAPAGTGGTVDRVTINQNGITSLYKGANVASAATITPTGNLFHVTGTTTITSVSGTNITAGTCITIIFDGVLTFTDGSNLKLAGNFVTTADDTISLCHDGTNWYETARAVN